MKRVVIATALGITTSTAYGLDPDFYLLPGDCQQLIGYHGDGSVKVVEGDPPTYACAKKGAQVTCVVAYQSGGKPQSQKATETFRVLIDSPPVLYFGSDNGAMFFSVNLNRRTVIITARVVEMEFIGQKVCGSTYATSYEVEELRKRSR